MQKEKRGTKRKLYDQRDQEMIELVAKQVRSQSEKSETAAVKRDQRALKRHQTEKELQKKEKYQQQRENVMENKVQNKKGFTFLHTCSRCLGHKVYATNHFMHCQRCKIACHQWCAGLPRKVDSWFCGACSQIVRPRGKMENGTTFII